MIYIHFIVNPISGNGKHNITASHLRTNFPRSQYRIEVDYTKYKTHAIELTRNLIAQEPDYVVACGGDGTINEVASCLVNTKIKLGIIPVGSGNGLASNLNIPKDIEKAIRIIIDGKSESIDVGQINDHFFFSNMGIGIDAMIIKKYDRSGKRTLLAYVKSALSASFAFKPQQTILTFNNKTVTIKPFLLFVSNSNEMGYNMSLTPKASLRDGMLDLVVAPQLSFLEKLQLGYCVLTNRVERFSKAKHELVQSLHVEMPEKIFTDIQIDGEHHNLKTNIINVSIIENGLQIVS